MCCRYVALPLLLPLLPPLLAVHAPPSPCDRYVSPPPCPGRGSSGTSYSVIDEQTIADQTAAASILLSPLCPLRNFFFLGNSVTRHYAFALRDMLEQRSPSSHGGTARPQLSRQEEKALCHGVLGADTTCTLHARQPGGAPPLNLTFMWKHTIGETHTVDDPRDVCRPWSRRGENVAACLSDLFRSATRHDVLIIGSMLTNLTHFVAHGGSSLGRNLPQTSLKIAAGTASANGPFVISALRAAFPGSLLWHSFAHIDMNASKWIRGRPRWDTWDVNPCLAFIDEAARCALATEEEAAAAAESATAAKPGGGTTRMRAHAAVARGKSARRDAPHDGGCAHDHAEEESAPHASFFNLRPLQRANLHGYADLIHHPGALSERIMLAMMQHIVRPL